MESTYMIVRKFFIGDDEVIKTGLTLEEAQEHCKDPETSGSTCTNNPYSTDLWFDVYYEE